MTEFLDALAFKWRALLAAAAMAGVLALVGTGSLSPWEWLLGAGGGAAAYVAVLVLSGETNRSELRELALIANKTLRPAG